MHTRAAALLVKAWQRQAGERIQKASASTGGSSKLGKNPGPGYPAPASEGAAGPSSRAVGSADAGGGAHALRPPPACCQTRRCQTGWAPWRAAARVAGPRRRTALSPGTRRAACGWGRAGVRRGRRGQGQSGRRRRAQRRGRCRAAGQSRLRQGRAGEGLRCWTRARVPAVLTAQCALPAAACLTE